MTATPLAGLRRSWPKDFADLSATLCFADPDLRRLLGRGTSAAAALDGLLRDIGPDLGVPLANPVTTGQVNRHSQAPAMRPHRLRPPELTACRA